jgi:hypothetical protein
MLENYEGKELIIQFQSIERWVIIISMAKCRGVARLMSLGRHDGTVRSHLSFDGLLLGRYSLL